MTPKQDQPKPKNSALQRDTEALSDAALDQVSGSTDLAPTTTGVSNVLKTKHDTVKNSISNVR